MICLRLAGMRADLCYAGTRLELAARSVMAAATAGVKIETLIVWQIFDARIQQ